MMEPGKKIGYCKEILANESDESKRWDAVWLASEMIEENKGEKIRNDVSNLMRYVLEHDDNCVVKHEACYQIAARNLRENIPDLLNSALNDPDGLVKHEAIESLGLLNAFDSKELVNACMQSDNQDVRQTAEFVMLRLNRMKSTDRL